MTSAWETGKPCVVRIGVFHCALLDLALVDKIFSYSSSTHQPGCSVDSLPELAQRCTGTFDQVNIPRNPSRLRGRLGPTNGPRIFNPAPETWCHADLNEAALRRTSMALSTSASTSIAVPISLAPSTSPVPGDVVQQAEVQSQHGHWSARRSAFLLH